MSLVLKSAATPLVITYVNKINRKYCRLARCCLYVSKLEHDFFGRNQNPSLPKAHQKKEKKDTANGDTKSSQDRLRLNFNIVDDEEAWYG